MGPSSAVRLHRVNRPSGCPTKEGPTCETIGRTAPNALPGRRAVLLATSLVLVLSGFRPNQHRTTSEALATSLFSPISTARSSSRQNKAVCGIREGASTEQQTIYNIPQHNNKHTELNVLNSLPSEIDGALDDTNNNNNNKESLSAKKKKQNKKGALKHKANGDALNSRSIVRPFTTFGQNRYADDEYYEEGLVHSVINGASEMVTQCQYVAETNLPTDVGHFRLRAYRVLNPLLQGNRFVGSEPCVIYSTEKPPFGNGKGGEHLGERRNDEDYVNGAASLSGRGVPVRIHDQCFTSEVFRSQRCDCKEQLKMSLEYIQKHGGAIIYLQQEGRGIGLANKIAAYALQDVGMDTVDANIHLGFPEDCRQYGVVPSILADMGIESIRLITNSPLKLDRLRSLGVDVVDTIPMVVKEANPYNRKYLETKQARMNHTNFGAMLSVNSPHSSLFSGITPFLAPRAYGVLTPNNIPLAEDYINDGEAMAAAAVASALLDNEESQAGVIAAADGYCFGRGSVEDAVAAIGRGELVVVVDDMNRENEGDFIMAADLATPETVATMVRYSSGVICIGMEGKRMDDLKLPAMVSNNEDPKETAFSVSVDAARKHGISTGISAIDRAKTIQLLGSASTTADDFVRPGHIFPLRAKEGGTLTRDGHTEASVDLARLAGRNPSAVLCEIVSEINPVEMARLPELKIFCKKHGFVMTSIVDIAQYRRETET